MMVRLAVSQTAVQVWVLLFAFLFPFFDVAVAVAIADDGQLARLPSRATSLEIVPRDVTTPTQGTADPVATYFPAKILIPSNISLNQTFIFEVVYPQPTNNPSSFGLFLCQTNIVSGNAELTSDDIWTVLSLSNVAPITTPPLQVITVPLTFVPVGGNPDGDIQGLFFCWGFGTFDPTSPSITCEAYSGFFDVLRTTSVTRDVRVVEDISQVAERRAGSPPRLEPRDVTFPTSPLSVTKGLQILTTTSAQAAPSGSSTSSPSSAPTTSAPSTTGTGSASSSTAASTTSPTTSTSATAPAITTSPTENSASPSGLATGTKIAIGVAVPVVVILIILLAALFYFRRRQNKSSADYALETVGKFAPAKEFKGFYGYRPPVDGTNEADGNQILESDQHPVFEMADSRSDVQHELTASPYQARSRYLPLSGRADAGSNGAYSR